MKSSPDWTYLAIFLWTNKSPGLEAVTTDSGTLESEQPIHNTYQRPRESHDKERRVRKPSVQILRNILRTDLGLLRFLGRLREKVWIDFSYCSSPLFIGLQQVCQDWIVQGHLGFIAVGAKGGGRCDDEMDDTDSRRTPTLVRSVFPLPRQEREYQSKKRYG